MTPSSTAWPPTRASSPLSRAGRSCVAASSRRYCFQYVMDETVRSVTYPRLLDRINIHYSRSPSELLLIVPHKGLFLRIYRFPGSSMTDLRETIHEPGALRI